MSGKFEESDVLFAYVMQDANGAEFVTCQPDNAPPRTTQLALQRLDPCDR